MATSPALDPNAVASGQTTYDDERFESFREIMEEAQSKDQADRDTDDPSAARPADAHDADAAPDPAVPTDDATDPTTPTDPATPASDETDDDDASEATSDDLLAKATPFTYTVDGQPKAVEGIREIPGHGAIVAPDALTSLRDRLQKADRLDEANKALYQQVEQYSAIEYSGKKGIEAVEAALIANAKMDTALRVIVPYLESEEGRNALIGDPEGTLRYLQRELGLAARETEFTTRQTFGQTLRSAETQRADASSQAEQSRTIMSGVVDKWAGQFPALTPEDRAAAVAHLQHFATSLIRPATPDEARQAGVKPGDRIVDERPIHAYLQERAGLRAEAAEAKQSASTATKAAQHAATENAKRLAAVAVPTKKGKAAAKAAPAEPKARTKDEETAHFMRQLRTGQWPDEIVRATDE